MYLCLLKKKIMLYPTIFKKVFLLVAEVQYDSMDN